MTGRSLKIIKRKDVPLMARDKTQDLSKPKLAETMGREKTERGLNRIMADTVSNWIAECRESNRAGVASAIRKMYGSDSLLKQNRSMKEVLR